MRLRPKALAALARHRSIQKRRRAEIGLDRVDNTPDLEKPVSEAVSAVVANVQAGVQLIVPVHCDAGTNLVLTNQASAEDFLGTSSRNQWLVNLSGYTELRLTCRVMVASASANTPKLVVRYYGFFSVSAADFTSDIGTSETACSLAATGLISSGWIALKTSAQADTYMAIIQKGGDGAADPEIASVLLHFR